MSFPEEQWTSPYYQSRPPQPTPAPSASPPPPPPPQRNVWPWVTLGVAVAALLGLVVWGAVTETRTAGTPSAASGAGGSSRTTSATTSRPTTTSATSGETKVVTATDKKSQVSVPDSWKDVPKSFQNELATIQVGDLRKEQYIAVITGSKTDFDDLAGFVKACLTDTEGMEEPNVSPARQLTVGGLQAVQHVITAKVSGLKIAYWYTMVEGKNSYFQVVAWTLLSRQNEAEPEITEVINSFREVGAG